MKMPFRIMQNGEKVLNDNTGETNLVGSFAGEEIWPNL